jgi:tRNA pseudouridine38-40 synthase
MNVRFLVAYDGTTFAGWQEQADRSTVQGELSQVLAHLEGRRIVVYGAARTDAGVHAEGQVVHCRLDRTWDPPQLQRAINAHLPTEIRVREVEPCPPSFHAGYGVQAKTYRYRLMTAAVSHPLLARYAWHYPYPFDVAKLNQELGAFVGKHDFAGFTVEDRDARTTQRTILSTWLEVEEERLDIFIRGDGFLRYQVRTMVSGVLDTVRGRLPVGTVADLLASRNRQLIGAPAPAKGLTLMKVEYYHQREEQLNGDEAESEGGDHRRV